MQLIPPTPADEPARLEQLRALRVLDTDPEPAFDSLARLAAEICGVPLGLVSLVDGDRQWFKAVVGPIAARQTPRRDAFCAHAIAQNDVLEVGDATLDPRFRDNPLVQADPAIRFYAGAPLRVGTGSAVGTLCVIDFKPHRLSDAQRRKLVMLAGLASEVLRMRQRSIEQALEAAERLTHELAAEKARYEALVERQGELVSLAKPNGELVYLNAAYARHHGCTVGDLVGTNLFDKIPPDERQAVRRRIDLVLNTGRRQQAENRVIGIDGRERWIEWTNSVQPDDHGRPLLHSVGRDVTDRVHAEHALRERESLLDRTGRAAGVGGWQLDVETGTLVWSAQTRRIHEVPDDYRPTLEAAIAFYAPEARAKLESAVAVGMRDGKPWDLELPFTTALGRHLWVRAVGEVEFEDGTPVRLVGALQDITERHLLQERLLASEQFVRRLTDSLPVRIGYVDANGHFRFMNDALCRRFGRPRDELLNRTTAEITGAADPAIEGPMAAALRGLPQRFEFDDDVAGARRRIDKQLIPDVDAAGVLRGVFTIGVDITERDAAQQSLRELTAIVESTEDLVVQTDRTGAITYLNGAARRALDMVGDSSLNGLNFAQFHTDETNRLFADTVLPAVRKRGWWIGDTTVLVAGRRVVPVSHLVIAHRDGSGRVARFSAVMRDESSKVEARRDAQRQAATLRSIAESIPACVAVVGADQKYRFVNTAYERWLGARREAIVGRSVAEVLGPWDYLRVQPSIDRVLLGESVSFERDYHVDGRLQHFAVTYVPTYLEGAEVDGFVGVLHDISVHRDNEMRLTDLSERDALTGLHNRAGFERHISKAHSSGSGTGLALLYLDLDNFKPVNDTFGHPVGDELLRQFAERLRGLVRPSDFVARIGGDEFVVLLHSVRVASHAQAVAAKIVEAAQRPFTIDGHILQIGASIGVAAGAKDNETVARLIERADGALYSAKRAGRGVQQLAA